MPRPANGTRAHVRSCDDLALPVQPNAVTRELYVTKFVPRMAERWAASAPPGANMEWRSY